MNDPGLNNLLKWGVSGGTETLDPKAAATLKTFLTGIQPKSEADIMREQMYVILSKDEEGEDTTPDEIDSAIDALEVAVGQIDNGHNLEVLRVNDWLKKMHTDGQANYREEQWEYKDGRKPKRKLPETIKGGERTMWENLVELLGHEEAQLRAGAAWCIATAVDNSERNQKKLTTFNVVPTLVKLATEDPDTTVRSKAILALSSGSRNSQPNLDTFVKHLPDQFKPPRELDAGNMDDVDIVTNALRADVTKRKQEQK